LKEVQDFEVEKLSEAKKKLDIEYTSSFFSQNLINNLFLKIVVE